MEKYGFVYIWFDKKRKMYYIGSHWGTETDGYLCSSNRMRDAHRRRPNDFKRRILNRIYSNREFLMKKEYYWLSYIKSDELGKKYYNLTNSFHFYHMDMFDKQINNIAKDWKIQCPDGTIEIVHNLKLFCRKNNLNYQNFHRILYGNRRKSHRGYKLLEKVTGNNKRIKIIGPKRGENLNKLNKKIYECVKCKRKMTKGPFILWNHGEYCTRGNDI